MGDVIGWVFVSIAIIVIVFVLSFTHSAQIAKDKRVLECMQFAVDGGKTVQEAMKLCK